MMTHLDSVKGKYSKTDKVYTKIRAKDEQVIGVRMKHPSTNTPPTAGQQTAQDKLAATAALVKAALADPTKAATYREEFNKQKRCKTLTGYVFHKLYHAEQGGNNNG